eukprot:PhF_6_TR13913/c0_g1_i2/m.22368
MHGTKINKYWLPSPFHYSEKFHVEDGVCILCDKSVGSSWAIHEQTGWHKMSLAIMVMIRHHYDAPTEKQVWEEWMRSAVLHPSTYYICRPLVSEDFYQCIRSLVNSVTTLRDQVNLVTHSGNLRNGKTFHFEQLEWVGDLVLAPCVHDVIGSLFDMESESSWLPLVGPILSTGGGDGFFTSNDHLEFVFDKIQLQSAILGPAPIGKAKSDTIEAILGELEMFCWSCEESAAGISQPVVPPHGSLYAYAQHTKNLLCALVVLVFLRRCLPSAIEVLRKIDPHRKTSHGSLSSTTNPPLPYMLCSPRWARSNDFSESLLPSSLCTTFNRSLSRCKKINFVDMTP